MAKIAPSVMVITTFSVVLLTGFWLLIMPQIRQLNDVQAKGREAADATLAPTETQKTLSAVDVMNQQNIRSQVLALLPTTDDRYAFSSQIEALSKNMGIPLTSYNTVSAVGPAAAGASSTSAAPATGAPSATGGSPANEAPPPALKKLTFSLAFTASYQDCQRFIAAIQSMDRYVQIGQVIMNGNSANDQVATQFTASAYYLPSLNPPS